METVKKPLQSNIVLIILIAGLVAFLLYIFFFVNPAQIVATLAKTNLAIYAFAFVAFGLSTFFSSLVWNSLLNNLSVKISKTKDLSFYMGGLIF